MAIPIIGKAFPTAPGFLAYLDSIKFGPWRPPYVVMHHTGAPDLKTWNGWQTRAKPVTDEQWMRNLADYYGKPASQGGPGDGPWQHGPHFFFTPKNYCVFSPPTVRGTHAKSFNANSWGVECVGDFDREPFDGAVKKRYVDGLACLHLALGATLLPFELKRHGLHFHRDDPLTNKTCPGKHVDKDALIRDVQNMMDVMSGGAHIEETIVPAQAQPHAAGTVNEDGLNVRGGATAKAPILRALKKGDKVAVLESAMNGQTKWLRIGDGEWVAARFVA